MTANDHARATSIALVDDHEIVAHALSTALATVDGLDYVGVAGTVDDLISRFAQVDLVVLDLRLADGSSPARNVEKLVEHGAAVVAFTSGESPYLVRLIAGSPILGIVSKSAPVSVLVETLDQAARGNAVMSTEWAAAMDADSLIDEAGLSPKEKEVLTLFATGVKTLAVASAMGISPSTVEDYVRRIRAKYARVGRPAETKVDLYKRAIEDGFLPLPGQ